MILEAEHLDLVHINVSVPFFINVNNSITSLLSEELGIETGILLTFRIIHLCTLVVSVSPKSTALDVLHGNFASIRGHIFPKVSFQHAQLQ